MRKNDIVTAAIDGYTSEGAGVTHIDGMAVFTPCAIAGETVDLRILKVQKTYAFGKLERVVDESPERICPDCAVYPKCGGCALRHMTYAEELRYKEQKVRDAFERIAGISVPLEPIIPSPLVDVYRNRAQFPVAGEAGKAVCGFYRTNTHDVIPTEYCRLQTPEAAAVSQAVLGWMNAHGIPAYNELSGHGLIRHICVRTSFQDRHTVLTLVAAKREIPHKEALIDAVRSACLTVSGIVLNINAVRTNVILGREFITLWGDETLTDTIGALAFRLRPASFFQVNPLAAAKLYSCAKAFLTHSDTGIPYHPRRLLDLYCGTGTIGLFCADVCEHVTGVEIVEAAVCDARENATANGIVNADFHCGDAGEYAKTLAVNDHFDAIIVDPPRKGLSEDAAAMLITLAPERIVYVSCDPATLARDIKRLAGSYAPVRARAVDMFPRTAHVETVVLMSRVEK
ncbi:MAG: 23S rRNA (uracil(1939)-C(5))-methyltransferase RlmD [Clostridiaceae bacterium]|nr:23S rRNA (uracil(1939)-C(5))-methyltransferase RlmD [Clostridiaceae bacterium]